eukprot:1401396-Rhodomonas_salina.1
MSEPGIAFARGQRADLPAVRLVDHVAQPVSSLLVHGHLIRSQQPVPPSSRVMQLRARWPSRADQGIQISTRHCKARTSGGGTDGSLEACMRLTARSNSSRSTFSGRIPMLVPEDARRNRQIMNCRRGPTWPSPLLSISAKVAESSPSLRNESSVAIHEDPVSLALSFSYDGLGTCEGACTRQDHTGLSRTCNGGQAHSVLRAVQSSPNSRSCLCRIARTRPADYRMNLSLVHSSAR